MSATRQTTATPEGIDELFRPRALRRRPIVSRSRPVVSDRHRSRDYLLRRLLLLGDLAALGASFLTVLLIAPVREQTLADGVWFLLTLPAWALILRAYGLYERSVRRIAHTVLDDAAAVFHSVLVGTLLLWALYRLLPAPRLVLEQVFLFAALSLVAVLVARHAIRYSFIRFRSPERVLMIGTGQATKTMLKKIGNHPEYGLLPVGVVSTRIDLRLPARDPEDVPMIGHLDEIDVAETVERLGVDRVVVSGAGGSVQAQPVDLVSELHRAGVKVSVLPQLFDALGSALEPDEIEGFPVLGVRPPVLSRSSRALKRSMDVALSSIALLIAAPLLILIALAIKLDSRGPVLFRQTRIGKGGRGFRLVKFRTMVVDAEAKTKELMSQSKDPNWLDLDEDPRVTRLGGFLRHSSLDELPQLWNVLGGQMSLVGPRPLSENDDRGVEGWGRARLDLTPGVTGLWQVLGRTTIPFEEMIKLDYLYVTNWSLFGDIKLVLRTLPVVLSRRGVN
jgi:exopolysaccharide biosynthesis polyprenyl glycosylphosphotransferase